MVVMKQLNSSYQDLHRIFRHNITAREIAEPLASFEKEHLASKVLGFMEDRDFDVVGVRDAGVITGYALRDSLRVQSGGIVGDYSQHIAESQVISESDPLLDTLDSMKDSRWVFISFLGNPSGIVTRGDLQKAPMRMWLFGLISLLEMQLLRRIRAVYPNEKWENYLDEKRFEAAKKIFSVRQKGNDSVDLAECLQIGDKKEIFRKSESLFPTVGFKSKSEWKGFMRKVEDLRDILAHSNGIPSESWPENAALVKSIENCLVGLEKG